MKEKKKRQVHTASFWMFILPALFLYALFMLVPLLGTVLYSLTNWDGISVIYEFVGIKNYIRLFTNDSAFRSSMAVSFRFVALYTILVNSIALALAVLLDRVNKKLKSFIRSVIFMPNVISLIMVSFIWQFMFTKVYSELAGDGFFPDITWFSNSATAMVTILITLIWQSVGYFMVIYVAGIESIDRTYYEAALIDGAGYWERTFKITFPLMLPSIIVNIFLSISGAFKTFEIPYLMTRGGPGDSTNLIAYNIYKEAYLSNHAGYASAKAVVLCVIVMCIAIFQIRAMKRKEVEA